MQKLIISVLILVAVIVAGSCTFIGQDKADNDPEGYKTINAEEAKIRIDSGEELIIVDVRTPEEYKEKHIPGAVLIPNETIQDSRPVELPDLDAEILIYCRSGNRSAQAAKKLSELGYTKLFDFGGIIDWPYETVSGN